jgi:hypothetical protein
VQPASLTAIHSDCGWRRWSVDRSTQRLNLAGGERLACDSLILDTGARPPRFAPPPGANSARLEYLRDIDDALAVQERLAPGIRLAVIGVAFMGLEGPASCSFGRNCRRDNRSAAIDAIRNKPTILRHLERYLPPLLAPSVSEREGESYVPQHRDVAVDLVPREPQRRRGASSVRSTARGSASLVGALHFDRSDTRRDALATRSCRSKRRVLRNPKRAHPYQAACDGTSNDAVFATYGFRQQYGPTWNLE